MTSHIVHTYADPDGSDFGYVLATDGVSEMLEGKPAVQRGVFGFRDCYKGLIPDSKHFSSPNTIGIFAGRSNTRTQELLKKVKEGSNLESEPIRSLCDVFGEIEDMKPYAGHPCWENIPYCRLFIARRFPDKVELYTLYHDIGMPPEKRKAESLAFSLHTLPTTDSPNMLWHAAASRLRDGPAISPRIEEDQNTFSEACLGATNLLIDSPKTQEWYAAMDIQPSLVEPVHPPEVFAVGIKRFGRVVPHVVKTSQMGKAITEIDWEMKAV